MSLCFSRTVTWVIYHEVFPSCHCDYSVYGLARDLRRGKKRKMQKTWVKAHLLWKILYDVPLLKWLDVSYAITCWETFCKKKQMCFLVLSSCRKLHILRNVNQFTRSLFSWAILFSSEFTSRTKNVKDGRSTLWLFRTNGVKFTQYSVTVSLPDHKRESFGRTNNLQV